MTWNLFKKQSPLIVIVCSANITRSPYFARLLEHTLEEHPLPRHDDILITSAGVDAHPGAGINPIISIIARMNGFPITKHRSHRFDRSLAVRSSLVLVMETVHKEKILNQFPRLDGKVFTVLEFGRNSNEVETFDVPDPTGLEVEDFKDFIETVGREAERIRNILAIHGLP